MGFRLQDSQAGAGQAALDGELTIYTVGTLKGELDKLPAGPVDIDLSGVTECDTAGLQWMLMAKRLAGPSVRFVRHSPAVLQMLDLSRLAHAVGDPLVLPHESVQS